MGTSLLAKHNNSPITAAKQHSRMEIHCKQTIIYEQTFQDREYCPKSEETYTEIPLSVL